MTRLIKATEEVIDESLSNLDIMLRSAKGFAELMTDTVNTFQKVPDSFFNETQELRLLVVKIKAILLSCLEMGFYVSHRKRRDISKFVSFVNEEFPSAVEILECLQKEVDSSTYRPKDPVKFKKTLNDTFVKKAEEIRTKISTFLELGEFKSEMISEIDDYEKEINKIRKKSMSTCYASRDEENLSRATLCVILNAKKGLKLMSPYLDFSHIWLLRWIIINEKIQCLILVRETTGEIREALEFLIKEIRKAMGKSFEKLLKIRVDRDAHTRLYIADNKYVLLSSGDLKHVTYIAHIEFGVLFTEKSLVSQSVRFFNKMWEISLDYIKYFIPLKETILLLWIRPYSFQRLRSLSRDIEGRLRVEFYSRVRARVCESPDNKRCRLIFIDDPEKKLPLEDLFRLLNERLQGVSKDIFEVKFWIGYKDYPKLSKIVKCLYEFLIKQGITKVNIDLRFRSRMIEKWAKNYSFYGKLRQSLTKKGIVIDVNETFKIILNLFRERLAICLQR